MVSLALFGLFFLAATFPPAVPQTTDWPECSKLQRGLEITHKAFPGRKKNNDTHDLSERLDRIYSVFFMLV